MTGQTKNLFLIISILFSLTSFAGKTRLEYRVKKDTIDMSVPAGKTRIYGKVMYGSTPVFNARISTLDHQTATNSDQNGRYTLLISSKDTSLYLYKPGYDEIVIKTYPFKSKHTVEIDFYPHTAPIRPMKKPVVYLYSEEKTEVSLALNVNGEMTFTYPKYNNGWTVTTTNNGEITVNNKNYPYLFWEGETSSLNFIKNDKSITEGFLIQADTIVSFLENSLTKLGLNQKEQTDFITFWGPQIEQNKGKVFLQFLIDEDYEKHIASLEINPSPTSSRRIYMLYSFIDNEADFMPFEHQNLPSFKRSGFTYIEWGGTEITNLKVF